MDNHTVKKFDEFLMLNEAKTLGKMDLGIIGPLANWSMKIQAYPEPNHGMIGYAIDEEENVELSYQDKKISIPRKTCELKKSPDFISLEVKPYTSWFSREENREALEDFIEFYLNDKSQEKKKDNLSISNDIEILLDVIGIPTTVTDCRKISNLFYEADLENGMQAEMKKTDENDLFKNLKIYKDNNSKFPDVKLKRSGIGKTAEFRCPNGTYSETADSFSALFKMPTTKYLMGICLASLDKENEKELVSHLQKLVKYHTKDSSNIQKYEMEKEEIERLKKMLTQTIELSHLEEMLRGLKPEK